MVNRISFKNFRGFENLELEDLKMITLITGKNNSGKSSFLEGIFLLHDHVAVESFQKIATFRGFGNAISLSNMWDSLFYGMDSTRPITITGDIDNKNINLQYSREDNFSFSNDINVPPELLSQFSSSSSNLYALKCEYTENDGEYQETMYFAIGPTGGIRQLHTNLPQNQIRYMPHVQYINATIQFGSDMVVEWFGRAQIENKTSRVIEILKILEPEITNLTTIVSNGKSQLYASIGNKFLPLRLAGDGMNKLLFIVLSILENENSTILIDEIDTGLHYSMFEKLWSVIAKAAQENNCQVIATTHSYECIAGAVAGMEKTNLQDEFAFYRLSKDNKKGNSAKRFTNDLLKYAIESDAEVR